MSWRFLILVGQTALCTITGGNGAGKGKATLFTDGVKSELFSKQF
ncbi:hypothetical protein [Chitinophaga filiformis]|nr:hypothetical protein [Chitinophaga filiformis]